MSWEAFEEDKAFVVEALRRGEFDHVEVVGQETETDFFTNGGTGSPFVLERGACPPVEGIRGQAPSPHAEKEPVP